MPGKGTFLLAALLITATGSQGAGAQPTEGFDPCAASDDCRDAGECTSRDGQCIAATDFDCTGSARCRDKGRCTAVAGECVATTARDCETSRRCQTKGECILDREEGHCDDGTENANTPLMISGIVVMGLGGLAMGAGAFLSTLSYLACRNLPPLEEQESCLPTPWLIMLGAGAGTALVIGMPMTIAGSRNVPRDDQHAAPSLIITPGAAMLRWRF